MVNFNVNDRLGLEIYLSLTSCRIPTETCRGHRNSGAAAIQPLIKSCGGMHEAECSTAPGMNSVKKTMHGEVNFDAAVRTDRY